MMGMGVAQQAWVSHFVIAPPLIVTEAELDQGINAMHEALAIADALIQFSLSHDQRRCNHEVAYPRLLAPRPMPIIFAAHLIDNQGFPSTLSAIRIERLF